MVKGVNVADLPERHQMILSLFKMSQCSWCRRFYTNEGFLCPFQRLQSNCTLYDKLSEAESWFWRERRETLILPRVVDMMGQVVNKGIMAKCRYLKCGGLNPNPQKTTCWKCGKDLCCPHHQGLILRYNIEDDSWKCPLVTHRQPFYKIIKSVPIYFGVLT